MGPDADLAPAAGPSTHSAQARAHLRAFTRSARCPDGARPVVASPRRAFGRVWCALPDGTRQGPFIQYDGEGRMRVRGAYAFGEPTGVWSVWYENGSRAHRAVYDRGVHHGPERWWYPSGRLRCERAFVWGRLHGTASCYRADGALVGTAHYDDDRVVTTTGPRPSRAALPPPPEAPPVAAARATNRLNP